MISAIWCVFLPSTVHYAHSSISSMLHTYSRIVPPSSRQWVLSKRCLRLYFNWLTCCLKSCAKAPIRIVLAEVERLARSEHLFRVSTVAQAPAHPLRVMEPQLRD
ncbi:hypothetical protein FA95DRAFT_686082 [Auriscalpium vulgare]|uniref:Uncharacterized protein n=1 Tax=Auriscalpium vulgare TaxID=40419 RepID=A0ACB8S0M4_9AGAM|nr:hypothetical protein FA95DRAFT_686082 [Auriscalpium vulgare]